MTGFSAACLSAALLLPHRSPPSTDCLAFLTAMWPIRKVGGQRPSQTKEPEGPSEGLGEILVSPSRREPAPRPGLAVQICASAGFDSRPHRLHSGGWWLDLIKPSSGGGISECPPAELVASCSRGLPRQATRSVKQILTTRVVARFKCALSYFYREI
jgi:hypothetical protein